MDAQELSKIKKEIEEKLAERKDALEKLRSLGKEKGINVSEGEEEILRQISEIEKEASELGIPASSLSTEEKEAGEKSAAPDLSLPKIKTEENDENEELGFHETLAMINKKISEQSKNAKTSEFVEKKPRVQIKKNEAIRMSKFDQEDKKQDSEELLSEEKEAVGGLMDKKEKNEDPAGVLTEESDAGKNLKPNNELETGKNVEDQKAAGNENSNGLKPLKKSVRKKRKENQPKIETKDGKKTENDQIFSKKERIKKRPIPGRSRLAQETWARRRFQHEKQLELKADIGNVMSIIDSIEGRQDEQYGRISEMLSGEANSIAERVSLELSMNEQEAQDEMENISQLIANSEETKKLRDKILRHYAMADDTVKEQFKTVSRSLEKVIERNNVFIFHVIAEGEGEMLGNESGFEDMNYEDDIDIILTLEPSISAYSSALKGRESWSGSSGFLLGGGQIEETEFSDSGGEVSNEDGSEIVGDSRLTIEKIDEIMSGKNAVINEFVINNPEIYGFFQNAEKDESGKFWAYDLEIKKYSELAEKEPEYLDKVSGSYRSIMLKKISDFRGRFEVAREKNLPLFIMNADRSFHEFIDVKENGLIEVGNQLKPEEIVQGRSGLPAEKRIEIGKKMLERRIFKKQEK